MTVKNIVIVGGGFAGVAIAASLEKALEKSKDREHRIVLVEKKSHFYHAIAGLRAAVLDWDERIMIPYTNLFKDKRNIVIQASAVQLEKGQLILDQSVPEFGNFINYDYLILATGTRYPAPAKAATLEYDTTRASLQELRTHVKAADSIVIVGGGPVGIELAGEIREVYANKKITIVHDKDNFLDSDSSPNPKLRNQLRDLAQKANIDTLFNDTVQLPTDLKQHYFKPQDSTVRTLGGKSLENVDLVLLAFGNRPETEWLKNTSVGAALVGDNGYVKVKKTFQVDHPDLSNVFVLGDAAGFDETKMAFRIGTHVPIVTENLVQMAVKHGQPTAEYKKSPDAMLITFGSKGGAGVLPVFGGINVGNWLSSTIKSKSLFVGKSWESLNSKDPITKNDNEDGATSFSFATKITAILFAAAAVAVAYKYVQ